MCGNGREGGWFWEKLCFRMIALAVGRVVFRDGISLQFSLEVASGGYQTSKNAIRTYISNWPSMFSSSYLFYEYIIQRASSFLPCFIYDLACCESDAVLNFAAREELQA
jgi:hypothetical protein